MTTKSFRNLLKRTFIRSIQSGIMIGIGITVYLLTSRYIGAFLFCIGLFVICNYGLPLYTGQVCYLLGRKKTYMIDLAPSIIWIGNFCGIVIISTLERLTRLGDTLFGSASAVMATKMADSLVSLFILGVFCNFCIFLAVDGYLNGKGELTKYLSIIFGVMVFVLCGFEHSIADMYYITMSGTWTWKNLVLLLVVSLGNTIGGLVFQLFKEVR